MAPPLYYEDQYFAISQLPGERIILCRATAAYIPMADFQVAFARMGELVAKEEIQRMIFDKSALTTFHQPSMEWYHVEWKEEMYAHGLRQYFKILPPNDFFVQSVKIGREKIRRNNPSFDFDKYDIRYFDSLADALADPLPPA